MTYEADLEVLPPTMTEPGMSAEEQIERRADFLIRELDEFCALATNEETVDLIEREKIAIGQILIRAQLVASFLMARHPSKLRVVSNG
jgi:hypothetical protein